MIIVIDTPRNDWRPLAKFIVCVLIRKAVAWFNVLRPPPGCALPIWFQAVSYVIAEAFGLKLAGRMFAFKLLMLTYKTVKQQGRFPTLKDLEITLVRYKARSSDEAGYRARLLQKVIPLLLACPQLDCESGIDLARIIREGRNVILDAPDDDDIRCFLTLFICTWIFHLRSNDRSTRDRAVFIIVDECLSPFQDRGPGAGVSLASKLITQLRGLGVGIIIITQLPKRLDQAVAANLNTVISFRSLGEQVMATGMIQNLPRDVQDHLPRLRTGQAIITLPGDRLAGPVLVDTPLYPYELDQVSDEELEQIAEESVRDLLAQVKKAPERQETDIQTDRDPNRLSPDAELLLLRYENKPMVMKKVAECLKWTSTKTSTMTNEIIKAGIWREGPSLGHNNKSYVLTSPRGLEYCQRWGIRSDTEKSGKPNQDRCHLTGSNTIQIEFSQRIPGIRFQTSGTAFQIGPKRQVQLDCLVFPPGTGGRRIGLQFAWRNHPRCEATALIRLARMGPLGPDCLLCVAASVGHMQAISKQIDRVLNRLRVRCSTEPVGVACEDRELAIVRRKIHLLTLDEVLRETTDLSWLKGEPKQ